MQRKLVNQPEIKLVGLSVRTNNKNEMDQESSKIGKLVNRFWNQNIASEISNRKNPNVTFIVYTEYDSDEHGDYACFIGQEVNSFEEQGPSDGTLKLQKLIIPAHKYQKFTTLPGKISDVVINAWQQIWKMSPAELDGKRAYLADFEVYDQLAIDPANAILDIYIGLK